jgi:hypothetical protein
MKITRRGTWPVLLLTGTTLLLAQDKGIRLNATRNDGNVLHKMVVVKASGEKMSGIRKIVSYDPATSVFVMEDLTGGAISIPASEIREIDFEQAVVKANIAVQMPISEVKVTPGSRLKYSVPKNAVRVDSGDLVLPASSPSTKIPGEEGNSTESPSHEGDRVTRKDIVEPRKLTVDVAHGLFLVEVQNVTYTTETRGGGSKASGIVK